MSAETRPSFSQQLRSGAQKIDAVSNVPVPIKKASVDGTFAIVPIVAECIGIGLNNLHLYPSTIGATLAMGTNVAVFMEAAILHGNDQMKVSEWIGPGIATGMRVTANIFDAATTNSL